MPPWTEPTKKAKIKKSVASFKVDEKNNINK